jgi:hypothetical protein
MANALDRIAALPHWPALIEIEVASNTTTATISQQAFYDPSSVRVRACVFATMAARPHTMQCGKSV